MKHKPEAIFDAAIALFDEHGVGVSTAKVAAAAGVSNGTLFNYFPTKQALLDGLYLHLKAELTRSLGDIDEALSIRDQVEQVWTRWLSWATAKPSHHRVTRLLHESGLASPEATEQAMALFANSQRVLEEARRQGLLIDLPDEYLAALIQQQLELAISAQLDTTQQHVAFDAMWNSITSAPAKAGTIT